MHLFLSTLQLLTKNGVFALIATDRNLRKQPRDSFPCWSITAARCRGPVEDLAGINGSTRPDTGGRRRLLNVCTHSHLSPQNTRGAEHPPSPPEPPPQEERAVSSQRSALGAGGHQSPAGPPPATGRRPKAQGGSPGMLPAPHVSPQAPPDRGCR